MDAATISTLLIAGLSILGWILTQLQAMAMAQRKELRWRRANDLLKDRYIYRLEHQLAERDIPLPEKPSGMEETENKDW